MNSVSFLSAEVMCLPKYCKAYTGCRSRRSIGIFWPPEARQRYSKRPMQICIYISRV